MRNILVLICGVTLVAACGGGGGSNPFDSTTSTESSGQDQNTTTDNGGGTTSSTSSLTFGGSTPPDDGTSAVNQTATDQSIIRNYGTIGDIRYEFVDNDTSTTADDEHNLYIDNLAFDGVTTVPHTVDENYGGVGRLDIYVLNEDIRDSTTNELIRQNDSRTSYGTSESGAVSYVVVTHVNHLGSPLRGYRYQRSQYDKDNNLVVFEPTENGQLFISGDYLGIRTLNNSTYGEYVQGTANLTVDLQDPNASHAIRFDLVDRVRLSMVDGQNLEGTTAAYRESLPDSIWYEVVDGLTSNGEFTADVKSLLEDKQFETGNVYGVLATNADGIIHEGAGVIVLQSQDPTQFVDKLAGTRTEDVDQYEEVGGFILERDLP